MFKHFSNQLPITFMDYFTIPSPKNIHIAYVPPVIIFISSLAKAILAKTLLFSLANVRILMFGPDFFLNYVVYLVFLF